MALNPRLKLVLDIVPLAVFFIGFRLLDVYAATVALIISTFLTLAIIYWFERRLAPTPLITALIVGIFGGLAIWRHDDTFIKIKPTLVNLVFAAILLVGYLRGKGVLRYVLNTAFDLTEEGWRKLSLRWGLFFLFLAALNEIVWRNVPTSVWVNFKVFGLIGLTMLFAFAQMGFISRHTPDEQGKS